MGKDAIFYGERGKWLWDFGLERWKNGWEVGRWEARKGKMQQRTLRRELRKLEEYENGDWAILEPA